MCVKVCVDHVSTKPPHITITDINAKVGEFSTLRNMWGEYVKYQQPGATLFASYVIDGKYDDIGILSVDEVFLVVERHVQRIGVSDRFEVWYRLLTADGLLGWTML